MGWPRDVVQGSRPGVCRVTVALCRSSTECPHHRRRRFAWPSAAAPPDCPRCSMTERVSVRPVGIRLGAPPPHRRRCASPSTFTSLTPRASARACRGRWASVCLARRLIRGLRADMRTDDQDRLRSRRGKLPRLVAAGHWLCV
jgi:hypothetical protein